MAPEPGEQARGPCQRTMLKQQGRYALIFAVIFANDLQASSDTAPPKRTILSCLNGLPIQPSGLVQDNNGVALGKLVDGNAKRLSQKNAKCDEQGHVWFGSKRVGTVEALNLRKDKKMMENSGYPEAPEVPGPYSPPPSYPGACSGGKVAAPSPQPSLTPAQILSKIRSSSPMPIEDEGAGRHSVEMTDQLDTNEQCKTQSDIHQTPESLPQHSQTPEPDSAHSTGPVTEESNCEVYADAAPKTQEINQEPGHGGQPESPKPDWILVKGYQDASHVCGEVEEHDTERELDFKPTSVANSVSSGLGKAQIGDAKSEPVTQVSIGSLSQTLVNDEEDTNKRSKTDWFTLNAAEDNTDDAARKVKFDSTTKKEPQKNPETEAGSSQAPVPFSVSGLNYSGINETILGVGEEYQDQVPSVTTSAFAILAGKSVDNLGNVWGDGRRLIGRLSDGKVADFAGKRATCDEHGNIWCEGKAVKGAKVALIEDRLTKDPLGQCPSGYENITPLLWYYLSLTRC
jgi:hypothetical protein